MEDFIHLLPEHLANQIAAGEVIQRPGSAVKELLENAIDAGATQIRLLVQDAGKTLVQVIDNGVGMSATDARKCLERHATSKIQSVEDLFQIRTLGFRGEALASITAVAQVEIKTRRSDSELGTYLEAENSRVILQEPCQCPEGTNFLMKNLFFIVPARRNFLKSNQVELRHILEEFTRVALAFPDLFFSLNSNGQEIFHLEKGSLKQRILQLLGPSYNAKIIPVKETADYLSITGFVGKPEAARKSRGDQYFFVNNRFIKSPYLHHAVMNAFSGMIPADSIPVYFLFITLDPTHVDINVHPTKQEIKFEEEKMIYAFMQSAVKYALGQFSISPTLDFSLNPEIAHLPAVTQPFTAAQRLASSETSIYKDFTRQHQAHLIDSHPNALKNWQEVFEIAHPNPPSEYPVSTHASPVLEENWKESVSDQKIPVQIHQQYILFQIKSGFILIDQQAAHERILYERFQKALQGNSVPRQQSLFPQTLSFPAAESSLLTELLPDLQVLGYDLELFGTHTFVIRGTPGDLPGGNDQTVIEELLNQFNLFTPDLKLDRRERLLRTLAHQRAIPSGKPLSGKEMQNLIDELFACSFPDYSPFGHPTYISFPLPEIRNMFNKK
ncbi:MAG: DNA mismatch repair endonuclease MutL [Chitinophagaceae bacterium]